MNAYDAAETAYKNGYKQGFEDAMVKHPCRGCVYFKTCGESTRTAPCNGRMTKRDQKKDGA